jgi:uncharacterized protein (TIGR02996 family)
MNPPKTPPARCRRKANFVVRLAATLVLGALAPLSVAQTVAGCGSLANAFGPWDYRKDRGEPLALVEGAHFNTGVENLIRGQSATLIGQDIDYVLRAFPNHHRALISASRLAARLKSDQPPGMQYRIECYFERAVRWKSDDVTARMLYADWLARNNKRDDALRQLKQVDTLAKDDAVTRYKLGLVYFELKEFEAARTQAQAALALGFSRAELRERLKAAGHWSEDTAAVAEVPNTTPRSTADAAASAASATDAAASAVGARGK